MRALDTLTCDERVLLRRVAEEQLVFRGCGLVWVGETGAVEVADRERELLRGLWRGGSIELPEGPEEERVTLTRRGLGIVRELQVFGEPQPPLANERPLTNTAVIEAVAATVLSPATLVRTLARGFNDDHVMAVFRAPLAPTGSVVDEAKGQLAGELGVSVGRLAIDPHPGGFTLCIARTKVKIMRLARLPRPGLLHRQGDDPVRETLRHPSDRYAAKQGPSLAHRSGPTASDFIAPFIVDLAASILVASEHNEPGFPVGTLRLLADVGVIRDEVHDFACGRHYPSRAGSPGALERQPHGAQSWASYPRADHSPLTSGRHGLGDGLERDRWPSSPCSRSRSHANLAEVLGEEPIPSADVPPLLSATRNSVAV